jgi:hypothetical protein
MADPQQVIISSLANNVPKWATEDTLASIEKGNETRNNLLKELAKKAKVSDDAISAAMGEASKASKSVTNAVASDIQDRDRTSTENLRATYEYQRKLGDVSRSLSGIANVTDTKSMFGQVSGGLNGLGSMLGRINPIFTLVIGTLTMVVEAGAALYHRLEELNKSTKDLYSTGLVFNGGMKGIVAAASEAGLSVSEFSKILTKFSAVGVTVGVNRMAKLNNMFLQQTNLGASLMMSQEEASDALMETMEIMRSSGRLVGMTDDQIVKSGTDMLKSFNSLAIETGRNRDEIRKATNDVIKRPDIDTVLRSLDAESAKKLTGTFSEVAAKMGQAAGPVADAIAKINLGGLGAVDEQMRVAMNVIPGLTSAFEDAAKGVPGAVDRMVNIMDSPDTRQRMRALSVQLPDVARALQEMSAGSRQAAEAQARLNAMSPAERAAHEAAIREQQNQQAIQNNVNASFKRFSNAFDKLALGFSSILLPAVNALSFVFEKLGGIIGGLGDLAGSGPLGMAASIAAIITGGVVFAGILKVIRKLMGGTFIKPLLARLTKPGGLPELPKPGPVGGAAGGMLGGIGKGLGAVGAGIKGIGVGTGKAIQAVLEGLGTGLGALSKPRNFIGVAVLGALAGVAWLAGKAFQQFEKVSWESMGKAAVAITGLGVAAAAAGLVGPLIIEGGISLGIAIGAIGGGLWLAAKGLKLLEEISWDTLGKAGAAILGAGVASAAAGAVAPLILVGAGALGGAIVILGGAIATASWIMGKALPTFAAGLESFAKIDGQNLKNVGVGLIELGAGLAAMGAGSVVNALGGIASGILGFFQEDPAVKIKRFVSLFDMLAQGKSSVDDGATVLEKINNINISSKIQDVINTLGTAFSSRWFSKDLGDVNEDYIKKFFHIFDVIAQSGGGVAASSEILNQIDKMRVSRSLMDVINSISSSFTSHWFSKDLGDVDEKYIQKFFHIFDVIATSGASVPTAAAILAQIDGMNISSNLGKTVETVAKVFSGHWFSKDLADVDDNYIKKFFHIFDLIGKASSGVSAGAYVLDAVSKINIGASVTDNLKGLAEVFSSHWIGKDMNDIDEKMVMKFLNIFTILGAASSGVAGSSVVLDLLGKLSVGDKIPDTIANIAKIFSSHYFSKDIDDIDQSMVEKFFNTFSVLGAVKSKIQAAAESFKLLNNLNIGPGLQQSVETLGKMFSSSMWRTTVADIKEEYLEKFFGIFDILKQNRSRIEAGAPALRIFHDIGVTKQDAEGMAAIADMFSWHATQKSLNNVDLDYIDILGKIFERLSKSTDSIIKGAGAMAALGTIDLSEPKIKGINSLSMMFTKGKPLSKVDLTLVDNLASIFKEFSIKQADFIAGADVLYQLGGLEFTDEKMKGLATFGSMFTKGALSGLWDKLTGGGGANLAAVDNLGLIFGEFGKYTNNFIQGAGALAALNTIDVDGNRLTNLFDLVVNKMLPEKMDPASVLPRVEGIIQVFDRLSTNQKVIEDAIGSLNFMSAATDVDDDKLVDLFDLIVNQILPPSFDTKGVLDRVEGMMQIFRKFALNQNIITQAVDSINTIGSIDGESLKTLQSLFTNIPGSTSTSSATFSPPTANDTDLDRTTSDYYEKTTLQFTRMIELLELAHADALDIKRIQEDGLNDVADAVKSSSGRIF